MTTETKPKAPAKKATAKGEDKPKRTSTVTPEVINKVKAAIKRAGNEGATLKELAAATGLTYRQVHNATWRMEGSPPNGSLRKPEERVIRRVNTERKVRYALRQAGDSAYFRGKYATKRED